VETARQLDRLRIWQRWLDDAFPIPGTRIRFGWDAIVGLVPGAGDLVSGLFGLIILYHAHRMRVPGVVQARMIINLVIDLAIGLVPFAGDVVDIFWKANTRNMALLDRHAAREVPATTADWLFVGGVAAGLTLLAALPFILFFSIGRAMGLW
jgi:hypothetical protein